MNLLPNYLQKPSRRFLILFSYVSLVCLGFIDYLTGPELSFSIFYILPVSLLSWSVSRRAGFTIAIAAALTWLAADLLTRVDTSHPLIPVWNTSVRLGVFAFVAYLLSELRSRDIDLAKERNLLLTLINSVPDFIYVKDNAHRFTLANKAVAQLFGVGGGDELKGKTDFDFVPEANARQYQADEERVMTTGQPLIDMSEPVVTRSGERKWVSTTKVPLRDAKGNVVGIVGINRDITERRRAEEELRASQERYRNLFNSSKDVIYISAPDGRFIDINPAGVHLFGYDSKAELLDVESARTVYLTPSDKGRLAKMMEEHGFVQDFEWNLRRRDGRELVVAGTQTLLHNDKGEAIGYLGIVREVTEQRELAHLRLREREMQLAATARIHAQEEERRRIAREIHDGLGQMLTAIKFSVELVHDGLRADNVTDQTRIREITGLLERAIAETRQISYNLMPSVLIDFGLVPALQQLCEDVAGAGRLKVDFQSHGLKNRLDPSIEIALYRIAQEALHNVMKHAQASEAEVQIIGNPRGMRLLISDNGKGFLPPAQAKLTSHKTGIGLISIRERTAGFGGTLRIDSAPGQGAAIIVEIPVPNSLDDGQN